MHAEYVCVCVCVRAGGCGWNRACGIVCGGGVVCGGSCVGDRVFGIVCVGSCVRDLVCIKRGRVLRLHDKRHHDLFPQERQPLGT